MSHYVDGFILSIKRSKLPAYTRLARKAAKVWRDCGALEYRECAAEDVNAPGLIPFPKLAQSKPGEVVIFAWAVFKSRRHRDATNKRIMADPRMAGMCEEAKQLVDCKRMAYGGFKSIVTL